MSELKIPFIKELLSVDSKSAAEQLVTLGVKINITEINWKEFSHRVDSVVYAGYSEQYLWLHYQVYNDLMRIQCTKDQEPVWQDSCVEFFLEQDDFYRNFEFNSIGVCLSAYGPDRNSRNSLDQGSLDRILRFPSISSESLPREGEPSDWSLTIAIPLEIIGLEPGGEFRANFYKCGDETAIPHYISWSPIGTLTPDFHQPEFFGVAKLVR